MLSERPIKEIGDHARIGDEINNPKKTDSD
jgi:hypothetical protein